MSDHDLRDWFCVSALTGLLKNRDYLVGGFPHDLVADAYSIADECMRQRRLKSKNTCPTCEDGLALGWVEEKEK